MREIGLQSRPSQAFSLVLENITYRIRIFQGGDYSLFTDVSMDTAPAAMSVRALHGQFLLPIESSRNGGGNFMWFDDLGGEVKWENFGTDPTCRLYYVSAAEIAKIKNSAKLRSISTEIPVIRRRLLANGEFKADGSQIANGWVR